MINHIVPTVESVVGPLALRSPAGPAVSRYIGIIDDEGDRFAEAACAGDLDVPVDACPGWVMRDLVEHLGLVHLWAAANIVHPIERWLTVDDMSDLRPYWPELTSGRPDDDELVPWYLATLETLIGVLESTPLDHECLTFLPAPSALEMWARRQACELAIHRHDAEAARGCTRPFNRRFAADMLDELLIGFGPMMRGSGLAEEWVLLVDAEDAGEQFSVTIAPGGIRAVRPGSGSCSGDVHLDHDLDVDLRVTGTASDLCVLLWNRSPGSSVRSDGDPRAMEAWRRGSPIRWC